MDGHELPPHSRRAGVAALRILSVRRGDPIVLPVPLYSAYGRDFYQKWGGGTVGSKLLCTSMVSALLEKEGAVLCRSVTQSRCGGKRWGFIRNDRCKK